MRFEAHYAWYDQWADGTTADFGSGLGLSSAQKSARLRLSQVIGREILWLNQNHGTSVASWPDVSTENSLDRACDIAFVDATGSGALESAPAAAVVTADCVPVLMAAVGAPIWAAVHAGRRGLEQGILQEALKQFAKRGVPSSEVSVVIGPSICGRCYQVDSATAVAWQQCTNSPAAGTPNDPHLDLPKYCLDVLRPITSSCVSSGICTLEDPAFPSYRRNQTTRRLASLLWLSQERPRVTSDQLPDLGYCGD